MADNYGLFWNSRGGDRVYSADSMEEWLKPFFVTGVFNGQLQVTATTGMGISVALGYCNINGKVRWFSDATTFTLEAASSTANRVDTVVVERNDGNREITLKVVTGTPGSGATAPVRGGGVYQLVLAQIAVARGATEISQEDITDTRTDSSLCGYVCATVDEIDFDQIVAQFNTWFTNYKQEITTDFSDYMQEITIDFNNLRDSEQTTFEIWFNNLVYVLDGDVAGHLQNEIDVLTSKHDGFEDCETVFNANGSITETYSDRVKNTVFNQDGSITETISKGGVVIATKTTTFNQDGSISEEVS